MTNQLYEAANYVLDGKMTVCHVAGDPPVASITLGWILDGDTHHFLNDGYDDVDEFRLTEMASYLRQVSGLINGYRNGFLNKKEIQEEFVKLLSIVDEDQKNHGS